MLFYFLLSFILVCFVNVSGFWDYDRLGSVCWFLAFEVDFWGSFELPGKPRKIPILNFPKGPQKNSQQLPSKSAKSKPSCEKTTI